MNVFVCCIGFVCGNVFVIYLVMFVFFFGGDEVIMFDEVVVLLVGFNVFGY